MDNINSQSGYNSRQNSNNVVFNNVNSDGNSDEEIQVRKTTFEEVVKATKKRKEEEYMRLKKQ